MNKFVIIVMASIFFFLGSVVFLVSGNNRAKMDMSESSDDTIPILDDKNVPVGIYIPNREYKVQHKLTIDTKDGTVTQIRMSVIMDH